MTLVPFIKRREARVGPVVGILTAGPDRGKKVPGNRQMFRYVLQACRRAGLTAYVFTPAQVRWAQGAVEGWQLQGKRFVPGRFPLPDVVYNRVPNRKLEHSLPVIALKRQLRKRHIPYFNPRYFNKLDLHRMLSKQPKAAPYMPWTGRLRGMADVDRALERFGSIYLKRKSAFAGHGILRVSRARGEYQVRYRQNNINRQQTFGSLAQLHERLRQAIGGETYIIQQAIQLARYRGRIFDIRLLAQRNHEGKWQVSGMGVRVASVGGITTHVPNGGYIASIGEVLPAVFRERAHEVEQQIKELALTIAPLLEKGSKSRFGEMSMDVGVTAEGRPFFFEANAKPMKFDEDGIRQVGLATLIGYFQHLASTEGVRARGRG